MTIRQVKQGIKAGRLQWRSKRMIRAHTEFQRLRLEKAIAECRLYLLKGFSAKQLAILNGRTRQAEEQVLQAGVRYLLEAHWIRPAREVRESQPSG